MSSQPTSSKSVDFKCHHPRTLAGPSLHGPSVPYISQAASAQNTDLSSEGLYRPLL